MGVRRWVGRGGIGVGLAAAVTLACQNQQFYPVEPQLVAVKDETRVVSGRQLPPNIMLVVDRSGSMITSATGTGLACTTDGTGGSDYDPRSTNPCKWNDLKSAFADPTAGFLVQNRGLARFGLLPFPGASGKCEAGTIAVPIGDDVQPIRDQLLNRLAPGGGTPTAAALLEAARDPALANPEPNRKRFAMLLTDGLPNCNEANAARCAACRADSAACHLPEGCRPTDAPYDACYAVPFDGASCLDEDALVLAVETLRLQGVETFVIGFGKDTAGSDAGRVLDRAAVAGGQARSGAATKYFQANTVQELKAFLEEIVRPASCDWVVEGLPTDPNLVEVGVEDVLQGSETQLSAGSDWSLAGPRVLRIEGDWCARIQQAEPERYRLKIRFVGAL